jgi:O-antigen biosynthesis protein
MISLKFIYHYTKKSFDILKIHGPLRLFLKIKYKLRYLIYNKRRYGAWIKKNEPSLREMDTQRNLSFIREPKISIIVPIFNTPRMFLTEMIESVISQSYSKWELCIADGASSENDIREALTTYSSKEKRMKVMYLKENKGIARNSNEAIVLATGDYIAFLDHDDTLAPFALFELVKAINNNPSADFLYSDEDILSEDGQSRLNPQFKPDWSPDLLRSVNYICHFTVISKKLIDEIGYFREGYEGSQDHDLFLRATERAKAIVHIPKILYHWRNHSASAAMNMSSKMYAFESGKKAVADHLNRLKLSGSVEDGYFLGSYKIKYHIDGSPLVSIIIPNTNHAQDLQKCIRSIIDNSTYRNFEIIIVDCSSSEDEVLRLYAKIIKYNFIKILEWHSSFNYSKVNNYAVHHAAGNILLFLNNDTEIINPDWVERLLDHALRSEVGAVGGKLYYPDNTVQHAGIVLGLGDITGHAHRHFPMDAHGYMGRLHVVQNVSAVTGACLMTRKNVFQEVQGFDEEYPLAFSDIDLCLKMRERGYLVVWTPFSELYHDESKTRGYEDTVEKKERFRKELERYRTKWKKVIAKCDPYYNINLCHEREDFTIKI